MDNQQVMCPATSFTRILRSATAKPGRACPTPRPLGSSVFSDPVWSELGRSLDLSPRELQIVRGLFDGRKQSAIAADLGISPCTVHTYFERMYDKLRVGNHVELLVRVFREFVALTVSPTSRLPSLCRQRAAERCPLA